MGRDGGRRRRAGEQACPRWDRIIAVGGFGAFDGQPAFGAAVREAGRWRGLEGTRHFSTRDSTAQMRAFALYDGDIIVGGKSDAETIFRWTGSDWACIDAGAFQSVFGLAVVEGRLFGCGDLSLITYDVKRLDSTGWVQVGQTFNERPLDIVAFQGRPVVRGSTRMLSGGSPSGVVWWTGSAWAPMGSGSAWITSIAVLSDGGLWGGGLGSQLYRWDGSDWQHVAIPYPSTGALANAVADWGGTIVIANSWRQ